MSYQNGGGYGDPFKRDPAAVLENVLDGLISAETARTHYGVQIAGEAVDTAATATVARRTRSAVPTTGKA